MLLADGFELAILGHVEQNNGSQVACYNRAACIEILVTRDGMSHDEAEEYFQYNVEGAYMGEDTPIYLHVATVEDLHELADA
jgi:hypothetical protein